MTLRAFAQQARIQAEEQFVGEKATQEAEPAGISQADDMVTVVSDPQEDGPDWDISGLMAEYHLDPEQWEPTTTKVNRWRVAGKFEGRWVHTTLRQFKVSFARRRHFELELPPYEPVAWAPPTSRPDTLSERPLLYLVTTDAQIPFHDENLHELTLRFAHDNRVDGWFDLGDFLDLPSLSRFRMKPEFHATVQESVQTGARVLYERKTAVPEHCLLRMKQGNHDERAETYLIDHAREFFGLAAARIGPYESYPILSLWRAMHAQEMGWQVDETERYPYDEAWDLGPGLIGIHGTEAAGPAGASVAKELGNRMVSVIQGHCNKLAVLSRVRQGALPDDRHTQVGAEAGMLGSVTRAMGFGKRRVMDWQQGFLTVTVWPTQERFQIDAAPYIDQDVRWRGNVWRLPNPTREVA